MHIHVGVTSPDQLKTYSLLVILIVANLFFGSGKEMGTLKQPKSFSTPQKAH